MAMLRGRYLNGMHMVWADMEEDLRMCNSVRGKAKEDGMKVSCWQETEFAGKS